MTNILELANVVRSKNAGPFELTFDIIFKDAQSYRKVKESGVITPQKIAGLYGVTEEKIVAFVWFDLANAIKVTILRPRPSGQMGDRDVYGAQQNAPLLALTFPF